MDDLKAGITRRELGALVAGTMAAAQVRTTAPAQNPAPGPTLDIAEWSYHLYGVEHALLARGTVCNGMQMYVEHWIPTQVRHPYPVVLIHGGYGQGSDWISTPDGRRGWATLLLEQGYKVYVIDRSGTGPQSFPSVCARKLRSRKRRRSKRVAKTAYASQRSGRVPAMQRSGSRRNCSRRWASPWATTPITQNVWRTRGAILLDDIGPAILVTHGDGAVFAWVTAQDRPELVKGIVAVSSRYVV